MTDARSDRNFRIALYVVGAFATAAYLGFIVGYPKVFPYIEQADPENYRQNVETAVARGDLGTALEVARFATQWFRLNPETYTLYGDLLLKAGKPAEARTQFEAAISITTAPAPHHRETRMPFFDPRARAGLGQLAWNDGDAVAAVTQFELAHPPAALMEADASYQETFFEAYAAIGAWSAALEFREPAPEHLSRLDREALVAIIAASEARQLWDLLARSGRALLSKDVADPAGQYAVGRALFAQEKYTEACQDLRRASDLGDLDAPYFLGLAHEHLGEIKDAVAAYRETPGESLYRAFALARAFRLQPDSSQAVPTELREAIESACTIPLYESPQLLGVLPWAPVALGLPSPPRIGAITPVVVRWERTGGSDGSAVVTLDADPRGHHVLRYGATLLQLQWAPNHFPLSSFEYFPPDLANPPGWFDPDVVWNRLRDVPAGRVAPGSDEPGRILRVISESEEGRAACYSMPVSIRPGAVYALAARMHAPDTRAVFGWEFMDKRELRLDAATAVNQQPVAQWSWRALVTQGHYPWRWGRVMLGVYGARGVAEFDNIVLLELAIPSTP